MSNFIIEYIGREGMKTTSITSRIARGPRPGDIVEYPENAPYPFDKAYGRIDSLPDENQYVGMCCAPCSVFLSSPDHVSISGGPFATIPVENLTWSGKFSDASFWNWGDNLAGAHQGVYFKLTRPVWTLTKFDTKY